MDLFGFERMLNPLLSMVQLLISSRNLEFFTSGYRYLIQILPAAVVAPMYFSGKIEFGVINQSVSAFNHILGDFSLIVYQFQAISAFSAVIDRLGEFDNVLDNDSNSTSETSEEISLVYSHMHDLPSSEANGAVPKEKSQKLLVIENLTLQTPTSRSTLIRDLSLQVKCHEHLLVTGPSGSGKTSLLRALAGLWNTGSGKIQFYIDDARVTQSSSDSSKFTREVFFLPQRPYMNLGTLRQQLLYPSWAGDAATMSDNIESPVRLPFLVRKSDSGVAGGKPKLPTTDELIEVLEDVRLGYILSRVDGLDSAREWSSVLSLGEQQRLAFARLLLSKPKLVLLDESTSALDEANEAHLYGLIREAGITYVSVGHRRTLFDHHCNCLHISTVNPNTVQPNWRFDPINEENPLKLSKP